MSSGIQREKEIGGKKTVGYYGHVAGSVLYETIYPSLPRPFFSKKYHENKRQICFFAYGHVVNR
jgi:hypothetical protein